MGRQIRFGDWPDQWGLSGFLRPNSRNGRCLRAITQAITTFLPVRLQFSRLPDNPAACSGGAESHVFHPMNAGVPTGTTDVLKCGR